MGEGTVEELADRVALRELVAAYARGIDHRDTEAVAALFCADGVLAVYEGDPDQVAPTRVRNGPREIVEALAVLSRYEVTSHHLGQQSIRLDGDTATGETYCLAHHISSADGQRRNRVLSIRYLDRYRRVDGVWRFAERRLVFDWAEERLLGEAQQ